MNTKTSAVAILAATLLLNACASSKPTRPDQRAQAGDKERSRSLGPVTSLSSAGLLLASFNRNADYSIDQSEFSAGRDASFKIADNDGSGSLNMFEIEHWRLNALGSADASPGSMFFDTDFNNIITHLEFDTGLGKLYQSSDKDGDGIIRFSELVRVTARSQGGGETREQRPSGERGRGGGGGRKQRG